MRYDVAVKGVGLHARGLSLNPEKEEIISGTVAFHL